MNKYFKNLNRLEFVITYACTGKCKHCSQGEHTGYTKHIDGSIAADVVNKIGRTAKINSLMTFGGEPLLFADDVCKIHYEAMKVGIPKRQIITNGYFSKDIQFIKTVAKRLADNGVNEILISVDAFHQETIPLEYVKIFTNALKNTEIKVRTQPAWLVDKSHINPYNDKTKAILKEFSEMDICEGRGNIIFHEGNAVKYLHKYFEKGKIPVNPYNENPEDIRTICISPNGDVLGKNIYNTDILDIINNYTPNN